MRLLCFFEWIAAVLIIAGIMLGLGKVAVDQIVYMAAKPVTATVAIMPPSEEDKARYLAQTQESYRLMSKKIVDEMKARAVAAP